MKELIEMIIEQEWVFADQMEAQSCPCGWELFRQNRWNYLSALAPEILESCYRDLCNARNEGWNPARERKMPWPRGWSPSSSKVTAC